MAYTVKGNRYAVIAATGTGTHVIVSAVSGKKIVIQKLFLVVDADVSVTLLDSGGTTIAGPMPIGDHGRICWPMDSEEWGHTASGTALQLTLSGAATVGGYVGYTEE